MKHNKIFILYKI